MYIKRDGGERSTRKVDRGLEWVKALLVTGEMVVGGG